LLNRATPKEVEATRKFRKHDRIAASSLDLMSALPDPSSARPDYDPISGEDN